MSNIRVKWLLLLGGGALVAAMAFALVKAKRTGQQPSLSVSPVLVSTNVIANRDVDPGSPAGDIPAPNFKLRDQQGRWTTMKQFRGKVVVLGFVDPHCADICPLMTESMVQALKLVGPAASQVQLLGISANPEATNVTDVAEYTRAHHMQGRWRFLTGSTAQLQHVWDSYHVYAATVGNDAEHEPIIILIGPQGHEQMIYFTRMSYEGVAQQARLLAEEIARLLPSHPAVPHEVSLQFIPPLGPTNTVQLPVIGSGDKTIELGTGHPHLLLFFAGWLDEESPLKTKLAALEDYANTASQQNLPSPVAIDELSTETSTAETKRRLAKLAGELHTPVVEDAKGRLGDGYGVKELPWFVLTSSSGRILWHHDGWLASDALAAQVRAALDQHQH